MCYLQWEEQPPQGLWSQRRPPRGGARATESWCHPEARTGDDVSVQRKRRFLPLAHHPCCSWILALAHPMPFAIPRRTSYVFWVVWVATEGLIAGLWR